MKLFFTLLCIYACIAVANAAVTTCYRCFDENFANCYANQVMFQCSNETFPNIGSNHCYTATGWYIENNEWKIGVVRGCANCSSDMAADKEAFKTAFQNNTGWTLTDNFALSCCNITNCNNQTLTVPATPTAPTDAPGTTMESTSAKPTTKDNASHLFPFSGILAFAVIVTGVILF